MKLWPDAQLPHGIAGWITTEFKIECEHVRGSALAAADDHLIFSTLRNSPGSVIVTKDEDFADLVTRLGAPPQVLWVRVGNVTNAALRDFFGQALARAIALLNAGESLVEMTRTSNDSPPAQRGDAAR